MRPCPNNSALILKGEHFPCDAMDMMSPESATHEGWSHSNQAAGALWGEQNEVATIEVRYEASQAL